MEELAEFKEQLTTLLIGLLFVLLAADVRMADVAAIGPRALLVVAALMVVVRPAVVWLSSIGAGLAWRDKLFISWIGPRGIVAAAVATVFATALARHGVAGGIELRALVFIVIATTVTLQGLSAGPLASLLGLRRASNTGYLFLGANELAILLAQAVRARRTSGRARRHEHRARGGGAGRGPEGDLRQRPRSAHAREGAHRFAQPRRRRHRERERQHAVRAEGRRRDSGTAATSWSRSIRTRPASHPRWSTRSARTVLFGRGVELDAWLVRMRHKGVELVRRMYVGPEGPRDPFPDQVLPLYREREGVPRLIDDRTELRDGDIVELDARDRGARGDRRVVREPALAGPRRGSPRAGAREAGHDDRRDAEGGVGVGRTQISEGNALAIATLALAPPC